MRPAWFTCAWRSTGGSPRRPPTRPMTTRCRASSAPRSTPRGSSRSIPAGRALRRRPTVPPIDHWDDATAAAEPASRAERVAGVRSHRRRPGDRGLLLDRGHRGRVRELGRPARHRTLDEGGARRHRPHRHLGRSGTGGVSATRRPRRGDRRQRSHPPGPRCGGRHRPRAGHLRGRPLALVRRQRPRLPRHLRLQRPRRRGGPLVRPRSARGSSTRPSTLPTTSRTRTPSASASTPRARRSGVWSSCRRA